MRVVTLYPLTYHNQTETSQRKTPSEWLLERDLSLLNKDNDWAMLRSLLNLVLYPTL